MSVLVYAEHDNASLKDATLAVVTAGAKLGEVHVLVAGSGCGAAADAAAKVAGVAKVLLAMLIRGARFDWDARLLRMTFDGRTETAALAAGAQDRLSVMYQFMFVPVERLRDLAFPMTSNGKKIENYRYQLAGEETLDTPLGKLKTLHLVKQREGNDNGVEIWLSTDHNFFPVKLLISENDGSKFEQLITRLEAR